MANWCTTRIDIQNEGKDLTELYNKINEFLTNEDGSTSSKLEELITRSGVATWKTGAETDIDCFGIIDEINFDDADPTILMITVSTYYAPNLLPWRMLLDKYCSGADIIYTAEESGCQLYQTNDNDLAGMWNVHIYDIVDGFPYQPMIDADDEYVVKLLQYVLETDNTNIEEMISMLKDTEYNDKIYINQWSYADI